MRILFIERLVRPIYRIVINYLRRNFLLRYKFLNLVVYPMPSSAVLAEIILLCCISVISFQGLIVIRQLYISSTGDRRLQLRSFSFSKLSRMLSVLPTKKNRISIFSIGIRMASFFSSMIVRKLLMMRFIFLWLPSKVPVMSDKYGDSFFLFFFSFLFFQCYGTIFIR